MKTSDLKQEFSWRGPEYLYKKKTPLWYTNVAVFFFVVFLGLMYLHNILGMAVLAFALWYFLTQANERPKIVDYKIDPLGVHIEDRVTHFESLETFSVERVGDSAVVALDPVAAFVFPTVLVVKEADLKSVTDLLLEHIPQKNSYSLLAKITHQLRY